VQTVSYGSDWLLLKSKGFVAEDVAVPMHSFLIEMMEGGGSQILRQRDGGVFPTANKG
jgi:hypothetical protein